MKYRVLSTAIMACIFTVIFFFSNAFAEDVLPFTARAGIKYVTVKINGVALEFVFDTGANSIVINNDTMLRIGITEFDTTRKIQSNTAGGLVDGYMLRMNSIQAGATIRYNYDITYIPSSPVNLLGASYFSNFNFYIDEENNVIRLIPKGSPGLNPPQAAAPSVSAEREKTGSERIEVEVDGKKYIYGKGWEDKKPEK